MKQSRTILSLFAGAAVLGALLLSGCPPPENDNPCLNTTCEFGTCNPDNGKCINRSTCNTREDCLPGYKCNQGSCEAIERFQCEEDGDCKTGKCRNDVCANPKTCEKNTDCLPGTYCDLTADPTGADAGSGDAGADAGGSSSDEGTCAPDPCNDVTCKRGTCQRGTDRCVSKQTCTEDTELLDCVPGEKCYIKQGDAEGECLTESEFCSQLSCGDNGVCSFEGGGCVNADTCSDETDCRDGYFCNSMNKCRRNLCERNDIDCGANGVCQPGSGKCENDNSCEDNSDCKSNPQHLCVDGNCALASQACGSGMGDGGCQGRQTCEYDSENQTATCKEPDTCETSLDCKGDRRCGGRKCLSPEMCKADRFEGNDSASNATKFTDAARNATLRGSLCKGNDDFYKVTTTDIQGIDGSSRGKLVVELNVRQRERGLGRLNLEVLDSSGNSEGTANTGTAGRDGRARVSTGISVPDHGTYTIKVTGQNMNQTGVQYGLTADIVKQKALNACRNATSISTNQRVSGTTNNSTSSSLGSSCTSESNPSNEKVYRLNIERPQELTFVLEPRLSSSDLTMSLRRRCTQRSTEIACTNGKGKGSTERMKKIVGPGTYSLIVQSPKGTKGGGFNLSVSRVFTVCSQKGNYCGTGGNANVCTVNGGRFQKVQCANDCNPSTGRCIPPDGNQCGTAKTIDPMNASTRTLQLNQARETYAVGAGKCLGNGPTQTAGKDLTYKVKVPKRGSGNASVEFEAKFADEVEGSLYLVEDCSKTGSTCKAGVKSSTKDDDREILKYSNTSMNSETLFLVVDTKGGQQVSTAQLEITYKTVICTPKAKRCNSGNAETCNEYGTKWNVSDKCYTFGCNNKKCQGETCSAPVNVPIQNNYGVKQNWSWDTNNFDDDYDVDFASCVGDDTDDADIVYELDLKKGDLVDATFSGQSGVSLYVTDKAGCSDVSNNCIAGADGSLSSSSLKWQAPTAKKYYLFADMDNVGSGQVNLDLTVSKPQCIPSNYTKSCTSGSLKYCETGSVTTRSCWNGNCDSSAGTCKGDNCSSPFKATKSNTPINVKPDMSKFVNDYNVTGTSCGNMETSDDTPGPDLVYEVEASAGDKISSTWKNHDDITLYLYDSQCGNVAANCIDAVEDVSSTTVSHTVPSSVTGTKTFYLLVDIDQDSNTAIGKGDLSVNVK